MRLPSPPHHRTPSAALALLLLAAPAVTQQGPRFTDVTAAAGVDFVPLNGALGEKLLPETMGGGVALLDHDGDGDLDLLLVGSSRWPWDPAVDDQQPSSLALYANDGALAFEDVTVAAGLSTSLYAMGPAVGDIEGDGDEDVYLTAVGSNRLYRNEGGFFEDGTTAAGVAGDPSDWSTAAGFLDHDLDGDLDLLVGQYVRWSRAIDAAGDRRLLGVPGRAYAPPMAFGGSQPSLFVNRGDGTFDEAAAAAGLHVLDDQGQPLAKALAFRFVDIDDDADPDVFVASDTTRNLLFVNQGDGTFDEQGTELGVAYDRFGNPTGAMGVDAGWFADDDQLGLFVGNFADEASSAYVTLGSPPFFVDETLALGLGGPTRPALTFGLLLFDADLDGRLDLLQANGHLEPAIEGAPGGQTYAQAPQLFLQQRGEDGTARFRLAGDTGDLAAPLVGRGATCGDLDGDGDLDLVLTQVAGPPRVLRNDQRSGNHWLRVRLVGRPGAPLALGAEVSLSAGGTTRRRTVDSTRGYLSQTERTVTFGLGALAEVEALSVRWPDGSVSEAPLPGGVDRTVVVRQPVGARQVQATLNRAKAQLETGRVGEALASLTSAAELAPDLAPTWRNLARARLASNDPDAALTALERADALEPDQLAALYLRAVALARLERHDEAAPLFEEVVRRDPRSAPVRFQLASAWQVLGRNDEALVQLEEAVRLDPSHGAAWYQLAVARRRARDAEAFRAANREFLRLRELYGDAYTTPLSLEACEHTLAEAAFVDGPQVPEPPPSTGATDMRYALTDGVLGDGLGRGVEAVGVAAVAVFDMDLQGHYTLAVARTEGSVSLVDPGGLPTTVATDLGDLSAVTELLVANPHDDAPDTLTAGEIPPRRQDLLLVSPDGVRLLMQQEDGRFIDSTERAGLGGRRAHAALWVDHEHDGDLDLALAGPDGFVVMVNVGGGRFEPSSEVPPVDQPCRDLAALDLDDNGAVDLVVVTEDGGTLLIENRRAGRFVLPPDPPGPWPGARLVLGDDLDGDALADLVLLGDDGLRLVFDGAPGPLQPLPDGLRPRAATLSDPDNDGRLDLLVVGKDADGTQRLALLANGGRGPWPDVSATRGLDDPALGELPTLTALLSADLDDDGDSDILLRGADGSLASLRDDGGNAAGPLLKLRLLSLMSTSDGVGVRVEVRSDDRLVARHVQRTWPIELAAGPGPLDTVLAVWPYGVIDARTDVDPAAGPLPIVVLEKADTGSCPFLYVWDGETRRFISDMVGSGATDLPLSREASFPVNPHEIIVVGPADDFPLVDGHWQASITSELREAAYYDEAALIVADHPAGTEVHSTDRLRPPPFRPSEVLTLGNRVPLRSALGSDGLDRTGALAERDGVHAPPGPPVPPPVRGQTLPTALELDFGPLDTSRPLVLALSGWIEFGTASTMIALSQTSDVAVEWPALEARDGRGAWHPLDTTVGLLGGKRRTVTVELAGLLPPGADRLRLSGTFELHLDRVALFERLPDAVTSLTEVRPDAAELRWRGFSDLRVRAPTQPKLPLYDVVAQVPPWPYVLEGWCTRYGDVLPLMEAEDGRLVVLNSGDEMLLTLPAADLPAPGAGRQRTLLWRSVGYNKEADPNNANRGGVWPLGPDTTYGRTPEEEDAWRLEWNTRWVPADLFAGQHAGTR